VDVLQVGVVAVVGDEIDSHVQVATAPARRRTAWFRAAGRIGLADVAIEEIDLEIADACLLEQTFGDGPQAVRERLIAALALFATQQRKCPTGTVNGLDERL
jgi:hypothetical protein